MPDTIPSSIAAVTSDWLDTVLHRSGAAPSTARVTTMRPTQIGQGIGIMGEIHRVELGYDGDSSGAPSSVVVKLPSAFEGNRTQGIALGMYEAEVRFYSELGPRTPSGLPRIHHAAIVPGTADFVIVMEDLSHLTLVDQVAGMTVEQAAAAVRVLASVHAAWWGRVQTDELAWIPSMVHDRIRMVDQMLPQVWPGFAATFGAALPAGGVELGERFSRSYFALQEGFVTRPWTLAHQDYRAENMLFGNPADDEVVVIDWQGLGRGPGAYDVAYVLGGSLPVDERRTHERALVNEYAARLRSHGIDYDATRVWDDYRYAHALGGLATSVFAGATLDLSNERGRLLIETMAARHFTAALDHDCATLMR